MMKHCWLGRMSAAIGFPWSARVSRAVSCVSRETVLRGRSSRASAHLLAQAATRGRFAGERGCVGADDADETSALPVRIWQFEDVRAIEISQKPVGAQLAYLARLLSNHS